MKLKRRVDTVAHLYESGFRELEVTGAGHVEWLEERIALLEAVEKAAKKLAIYHPDFFELHDALRAAGYLGQDADEHRENSIVTGDGDDD